MRKTIRSVLAIFCSLIFVGIVVFTIATWSDANILKNITFNELVDSAIQLKLEQSRSEFQLGLLITGALWVLVIAKKDEGRILLSDPAELTMFIFGNLLLLGSFICHIVYLERIGYIYSLAGGISDQSGLRSFPDVFSTTINNPYRLQLWYLVAGVFVAALTVISAHLLKGKK